VRLPAKAAGFSTRVASGWGVLFKRRSNGFDFLMPPFKRQPSLFFGGGEVVMRRGQRRGPGDESRSWS